MLSGTYLVDESTKENGARASSVKLMRYKMVVSERSFIWKYSMGFGRMF
jgi:hypothetical protein